ncbi:acyl-CoA dehydrogenase family protein [Streptomyces genisteinicus]|uniref:Acyl-CoA dehydrogenase family protein n=1 Tax=Streptomyces genisteinicus TaxID=2768068 RepID=A0A7H0HN72_9ACTN|nr:acyl-CoA dehydrogenase family protein [Streptomyces genisteinicus]QNP61988.1 acyl-CoA dehydrogenase family protein [Streptomyces genisteinicus]
MGFTARWAVRTSTRTGRRADDDLWQRVVRELADDLAVDALLRDRAGKPPYDEVARLKEAGLPGLLVPPSAWTPGCDLREACTVLGELAAADSSVAELLARHYALAWSGRLFGTPPDAERFERRTAAGGQLLAGGVDLPEAASGPPLTLRPSGGGLVLSGCRVLEAGATVADCLVVDASPGPGGDPLVVLVDPAHPGVCASPAPERLGQRLTGAGSVVFDSVPVTAEDVVGAVPRDERALAPLTALTPLILRLLLSHVALGTAEGALAEARDISRAARAADPRDLGRPFDATDGRPATDPYLLLAYGESATEAHAAASVVERATAALAEGLAPGREPTADESADIAALVGAAEAVTARSAVHITTRVLGLFPVSGPADTDAGLDRFWRNARMLTARHSAAHSLRDIGDHYLNGSQPRLAGHR